MGELTEIFAAIQTGDLAASQRLLPLVYDELKVLAAQKMAREPIGGTLQATVLVHEAYLRLLGSTDGHPPRWDGRGHFFAAAAEAMRRILIDAARRRTALKRGGAAVRNDPEILGLIAATPDKDLLAIDEVLDRLNESDPQSAQLVKLRFFVGLNTTETAEALGISVRTAHDVWVYARAWLRRELTD